MANNLKQAFKNVLSRLFPRSKDFQISVDSASDESNIYVDIRIENESHVFRLNDLKKIPARIRVGNQYFRVSKKNRHTLKQLATFDPRFDGQRGFIFPEKDVPEILNYLRAKESVDFTKASRLIHVDDRPLEYEHQVSLNGSELEVLTSLQSQDSRIRIERPEDGKLADGSKYLHAHQGYFKQPIAKQFRTLPANPGRTVLQSNQIPYFLLHDLNKIKEERRSKLDDNVQRQKVVTEQLQPKVSLQIDGPWLWFDLRYEADKYKVRFQEVEQLDPAQSFVRQKDTWIQVDKKAHSNIRAKVTKIPELQTLSDRFRTRAYHFDQVESLLREVATIDVSEAYARFRKSLEDFSRIEEHPLPPNLRAELRTYQKHGYDWLAFLQKYGLNGILADEMGLGKTVQAITKLVDAHSDGEQKTSLVVCPPSVLSAWEDDFKKFTSTQYFRTAQYVGSGRQRVLLDRGHYAVILTTYSIVTRDIEALSKIQWEYVVLDEAQKIKNAETSAAKSCKRLLAKHKLALSGTPIENRLSEVWSIYDFLMPSYLGTQSQFKNQFEIPIVRRGDRTAQAQLRTRIHPFKLRREKSLVATELPPKIYMDRYCELTPEQVQLYKHFASAESERIKNLPGSDIRLDTSIMTAILRLKQICCHPALVTKDTKEIYGRSGKLEVLIEIIEEILENEERALIFSQFTEMHSILRRLLDEKGLKYLYLDGSTPLQQRSRLKEEFQEGKTPFFLISLQAGGLGLTLTKANCVIHYDRWWNPAVEDQATDRAHRIGQTDPVKVFKIHTSGTIDERIGKLQAKKKDLFNSIIEVDQIRKEVSKDELLALFAPPK